jgi:hypothetical protein
MPFLLLKYLVFALYRSRKARLRSFRDCQMDVIVILTMTICVLSISFVNSGTDPKVLPLLMIR